MFSKKLDCTCLHIYGEHQDDPFGSQCKNCSCSFYDPQGHNPEQENFLCPQCRLTRMEKSKDSFYYCVACSFILFDRQVKELLDKLHLPLLNRKWDKIK